MLKIGIVGAGIISHSHMNAIMNSKECRLAAVTDIVLERAKEMAEQAGVNYYTDYKKMQEKEELDAVILNLPHFLHQEVSVYFLNHKVHVLVEKPMANSVDECQQMIDAARNNKVKLAVAHPQRFFPVNKKIKEIIENETYGKLCMITEVRNVHYFDEKRPKWFLDKKLAGGGIVMNYFAHTLDKIFYVYSDKIRSVEALCSNLLEGYQVEGNAQILLKFEQNVSASATFCGYKTPNAYETIYYFSHGAIKALDTSALLVPENNKFVPLELPARGKHPFEEQLEEFIKYIHDKDSIIVTAEYGKKVIETIEKVYSS